MPVIMGHLSELSLQLFTRKTRIRNRQLYQGYTYIS